MSYSFNSSGYTLSNYLTNYSSNTIGFIGATGGVIPSGQAQTQGFSAYAFRNISALYVTPGVWLINAVIAGTGGIAPQCTYFYNAISTNGFTTWSNRGIAGYTIMSNNVGNTLLGVNMKFSNSGSPYPYLNTSALYTFTQGTTSAIFLSVAAGNETGYVDVTSYIYYFKCVRIA